MKRFGFTVITMLTIGLLGSGGYFAIKGLTDPKSYVPDTTEKVGDMQRVTTETSSKQDPEPIPVPRDKASVPAAAVTTEPASTAKTLAERLQVIDQQNLVLKKGSKGTAVGTVQEFMNAYYKKNLKIDNDFGKILEEDVKKFQAAMKITTTGQLGDKTLQQMIAWAKKNNTP
ncbi:peptidoglycan-binding protein [bacterium]|nr:peptidoglycan-binding protein [bacterium]